MEPIAPRMNPGETPYTGGAEPPERWVIAIDGPAGAGKSSTARAVADSLNLLNINSGSMYRALTWAAQAQGIAVADEGGLVELLRDARLEMRSGKRDADVIWNGQPLQQEIRSPAVDAEVSDVSAHPAIRRLMIERQRELGRGGGVVMEGRDIGSRVFPLATVKIFLDASLPARTERRFRQYRQQGVEVGREDIATELNARDRRDCERSVSPLIVSPDAVVLDTSALTLPAQIERTIEIVRTVVAEREGGIGRRDGIETMPWKYRLAYHVMSTLARFYGLQLIDRRYLEHTPGAIIAGNHVSWWDPPLVGSTFWRHPVGTLAKSELFYGPLLSSFFKYLDAIPIQRQGFDSRAFGAACEVLAKGGNLFIFPEGTRRPIGRPGPVRSGLGVLMQRTLAPVIPVFVRGTSCLQPGGSVLSPLEVRFGPSVRLRSLEALRAHYGDRGLNQQIGRLFDSIYEELQARSFADRPQTEWEMAEGARQERAYLEKYQRLFGRRPSSSTGRG
jgi:cytidylate kinase